ncbi:hypothetical protein RJ639_013707 [Escallonia herrerae]|uniref:Uncharacterized protein n=1 Tax=Escallonia herrerae TaxID=1293975 RepID=A0AA89AME5_9ASTE|nr:hypothetical protein RJ639_013707 [Escallonia herrerae]
MILVVALECEKSHVRNLWLRHEKYVTQYRAIFVINCKIKSDEVSQPGSLKRKRVRRGKGTGPVSGESLRQVGCTVCSTEVGVIDEDEFVDAIGNSSNLISSVAPRKGSGNPLGTTAGLPECSLVYGWR